MARDQLSCSDLACSVFSSFLIQVRRELGSLWMSDVGLNEVGVLMIRCGVCGSIASSVPKYVMYGILFA